MLVGAELNSELAKISREGKIIEEKHETFPITKLILPPEKIIQIPNGRDPASKVLTGFLEQKQGIRFHIEVSDFEREIGADCLNAQTNYFTNPSHSTS